MAALVIRLRELLQRFFHLSDWQAASFWAVVVGVVGALATEAFRWTLHVVEALLFGHGEGLVAIARGLPWYWRIAVPAIGGLFAGGLLVLAQRVTVKKATSDYMEAIVVGDGRIPTAQTLARSGSSLVSIASGASIGREGSMVQLAALGASLVGRLLRFPVERLRLLVACGAAAGITAAYNAPIAGAFFVAEIVLGSIAMEIVGPLLLSAVVANIVMREFPGYQPVYEMPSFPPIFGVEVVLFGLMGILIGLAAAFFLRGLQASRHLFSRVPVALPLRLALGGLAVGVISAMVPEVWGNGYSVVNSNLRDTGPWLVLLGLLVAKGVATLATVGSGAVGGVFTPALFFGCMIGALFGTGMQALWPLGTSAPFAYAIVGMGSFLAAMTQAPLMAILMIFEMTLSYQVMLPLMAACVTAYFVARSADAGAMYEVSVRRRKESDARLQLRKLQLRTLVEPALTTVGLDAERPEMMDLFRRFPVKYLYVIDSSNHYLGVVSLKALSEGSPEGPDTRHAADFLSQEVRPVTSGMDLAEALQRFMEHHGERLPLVESSIDPVLLGAVSKSALLQTYVKLSA